MFSGDVVLVDLMTNEGKQKRRPALILKVMPKYNDYLVCGISSQIEQYIPEFDLLIDSNSNDYITSNLLKNSVVRLGYLAVIPSKLICGKIGNISKENLKLLLTRLSNFLLKE